MSGTLTHRIRSSDVALHVQESGSGEPAVLLVHGIACDLRFLAPQAAHLSPHHRTVAVDLRGHGASDAPPGGPYDAGTLLDDLVAVCRELALERPVVVGHSLGGVLALALAAREPGLPGAVVALDSPLAPPRGRGPRMLELFARLRGDDYAAVLCGHFEAFFDPADAPVVKRWVLEEIVRPPAHAVIPVWEGAAFGVDTAAAAAACRVPLLYVDAGTANAELDRLAELCAPAVLGRTVGAGHFHQLLVPDQVNAMLDRFLELLD